ncbi:glycoside hydrolase family 9 protein [Evansella cellulosilytica]|uniref:Endoglucanase n=1 Tax=Evansella cellulosilytica (strain ATCC 21833 / DSM 2522 / FERM P-1141 / JCM 9156 / N-4) TaxID=649639 RepID=E6U2C0_EVAC2|nr:glycoside hydrolase family 9 protein [Evansella cellulosilytica]ADU31633.1 LPXTG-motif cell wall anchor domain protein [Evansella cellulosilytica DSM 2522]
MKNKKGFLTIFLVFLLIFSSVSFISAESDGDDLDSEIVTEVGPSVKVNQVGYLPNINKIAIVVDDSEASTFNVINNDTDEIVYSGELTEPVFDEHSGDVVKHADFTYVTEPGTYVVHVPGVDTSFAFDISNDVYYNSLLETMRSYTTQRSATAIDDPITGIQYEAGHLQDQEAIFYFTDEENPELTTEGDTIDVSAGWYDAGDYGLYVTPGSISVSQLLYAYELNPETFYSGQMSFPEGVSEEDRQTDLPDILIEAKHKLLWLEKMQREDGVVYHKVSGLEWPGMDVKPVEDTQDRYVFGMSTYGTAMYGATMAIASRQFSDYDQEFADRLLANAELAFEYLEAHPEPYFREDDGQNDGSGAYGKRGTDNGERFWLAAELLKTTGDSKYDDYIHEYEFDDTTIVELFDEEAGIISWGNGLPLAQYAYILSDNANEESKAIVQDTFLAYADDILAQIESDGYRNALEYSEYTWASAKNAVTKGNYLLFANEIQPNDVYIDGALDQLHYILGRTATGMSYLTGSGTKSPQHVHHRIRMSTDTYMPGLLVGGPNGFNGGGDPEQARFFDEDGELLMPIAKAYVDHDNSWSTNEYAIDYTAPALFSLAYFSNPEFISGDEEDASDKLEQKVAELESQIEELNERLQELENNNEIDQLQLMVDELEAELVALSAQYDDVEALVTMLEQQVESLKAQIEELMTDEESTSIETGDEKTSDSELENGAKSEEALEVADESDSSNESAGATSDEDKGDRLPDTATSTFNYLLLGTVLFMLGTAIFLLQRRKLLAK